MSAEQECGLDQAHEAERQLFEKYIGPYDAVFDAAARNVNYECDDEVFFWGKWDRNDERWNDPELTPVP